MEKKGHETRETNTRSLRRIATTTLAKPSVRYTRGDSDAAAYVDSGLSTIPRPRPASSPSFCANTPTRVYLAEHSPDTLASASSWQIQLSTSARPISHSACKVTSCDARGGRASNPSSSLFSSYLKGGFRRQMALVLMVVVAAKKPSDTCRRRMHPKS
ncbi:hypothetical protein GALMADRAFT_137425 [Galerina marginata CBS 339.88]|uniref:Uncharacterized protein n=1 Tax=Galerina marginata (strain CBS 339.88) TaxID=685588 RepID=A0A067T8V2_GALM3|nr:hypothetical protein GALMADRAFT_137425 [Galerina marginata CBS 339.88]